MRKAKSKLERIMHRDKFCPKCGEQYVVGTTICEVCVFGGLLNMPFKDLKKLKHRCFAEGKPAHGRLVHLMIKRRRDKYGEGVRLDEKAQRQQWVNRNS